MEERTKTFIQALSAIKKMKLSGIKHYEVIRIPFRERHPNFPIYFSIAVLVINQIDNSRMRRLITLRYIEGLSWVQVARKMGKHHTADGCRMAVERFLAKI